MAYDTFTSTWIPTYGASVSVKPKLRVIQYGDGYKHRQLFGINNKPQVWVLRWERSGADSLSIYNFIQDHIGTPFKWTNPDGELIQVTCDEGATRVMDNYGTHTVTATFEQDFSPEV